MHVSSRQGFTLIELLVVIAIIAILAVVVVLTLNPAELLRQSRDANRLSDLATITNAINIYNTDQGGASGYSLGSANVTYLSVPDPTATTTAGTNCSGLGGNIATGTAFFQCPASSTSRNMNATGWIPINFTKISAGTPIGSLPIDPTNTTSSNLYYTYQTNGTTFRIGALPESQKYQSSLGQNPLMFTAGSNPNLDGGAWVLVPGNATFGTNNFYGMKYDAACANISTGAALTTPTDGNGYHDNNSSANNCTSANGLAPAALPNAIPIVDVFQTSAASYCASIGAHLITNNEWQTIAWNTEGVTSNWSGGTVGSGYVYSGHNDSNPSQASVASASDGQGCVGTDGPSSCGGTGSNATQLRTLTLSNGSVVWDMAGNLWQWTNNTILGTQKPAGSGGTGGWSEWTTVGSYDGTILTKQKAGPANSAWNSSQGIGQYYEGANDGNTYDFLRGSNWGDGGAGAEALSLYFTPGSTAYNIGFRCAR
jgi:prepilin-type N-terminal cleavage/methylation domain-containing protein